mmetsp:Transcript_27142/g.89752  ORF Transcript_27142/g.89752 Transcript_27142/m.89752 type:complete len:325 (-) Transcript_27142:34-1008(-)
MRQKNSTVQNGSSPPHLRAPWRACRVSQTFCSISPVHNGRRGMRRPEVSPLPAPRPSRGGECEPARLPLPVAAPDREGTARTRACHCTTCRFSCSSRRKCSSPCAEPNPRDRSGNTTRTAPTAVLAPGLPRGARERPHVPPQYAREPRRRPTAARARRTPPPAATAGAPGPPPAPSPPPGRRGPFCRPSCGPARASRCVGSPSNNTWRVARDGARNASRGAGAPPLILSHAFISAPGAHCVVPQGQLSLAFSPHMLQESRSLRALARAFLISYSFCLICQSFNVSMVSSCLWSERVTVWWGGKRRGRGARDVREREGGVLGFVM